MSTDPKADAVAMNVLRLQIRMGLKYQPPVLTRPPVIRHKWLFRFLCRVRCPRPAYYWLLDRFSDNNGWRPLSMRTKS